jgi:hypothetical protein
MSDYHYSEWYDERGNYAGSPKIRDARAKALRYCIAELDRLRDEALNKRPLTEFERMAFACWPTIREALLRTAQSKVCEIT